MWRESAIILAALCIGCGSTGGGISFGEPVNDRIRKTLTEEKVEEMSLLTSGRAYWIGPDALKGERRAFLDALATSPVSGRGTHGIPPIGHARNDELTLNNVGPDAVIGFYHPTEMLDVSLEGSFVRVLRLPAGGRTGFEVWTQDPDWESGAYVMVVPEHPALQSAWSNLVAGAKTHAGKIFFGSPYAAPLRGAPLRTRAEIMRGVGLMIER